jgi:hypothetical protein
MIVETLAEALALLMSNSATQTTTAPVAGPQKLLINVIAVVA